MQGQPKSEQWPTVTVGVRTALQAIRQILNFLLFGGP